MTDPVPEASVLTRSEPTEAQKARAHLVSDLNEIVRYLRVRGEMTMGDRIIEAAALIQAALPVPAGRKATDAQIEAAHAALQEYGAMNYSGVEAALNAALSLPVPADRSGEWMPIDSASKDGELILAYKPDEPRSGDYMAVVYWGEWPHGDEGWIAVAGNKLRPPTHWMPLPDPPLLSLKGEGK